MAALALLGARAADAARFGVPAPPLTSPPGYFTLVSADAVDPIVSDALGDPAHFLTLYIEVERPGIHVDLFDPGVFSASLGAGQLDVNLDPLNAPPASMRYRLYGPEPGTGTPDTLLADMRFGADTAATNGASVALYDDAAAVAGLYHLTCHLEDGLPAEQDVSVFGVSVPGHAVYTLSMTAGEVNEGAATVAEPVSVFPYVVQPTAATDAFGPLCGAQFVTYDLDAASNGSSPPDVVVTTRQGFAFPALGASGDARWWAVDLAGINPGFLDSGDHGIWRWDVSMLTQPEDAFGNLSPAHDFNVFGAQVLDFGAGRRDAASWRDLPDRPPFIVFAADKPRRIYLPDDGNGAPLKEVLGHGASVVGGFPVIAAGETSTVEVTLTLTNPTTYTLTGVAGETHVNPDPQLSDPTIVSTSGGLAASIDAGDARHVLFGGDVAAGAFGEVRYRVDITPTGVGQGFLTGDGSDFVAPAAPTQAAYQTPFTRLGSFELAQETQGPICQLAYVAVTPPCAVTATLEASALRTCPGTDVSLDARKSELFNCPGGGFAVYQWTVNGDILIGFPGPDHLDVRPFANDTYEVEVACSTDSSCTDTASVTFDLYPAPKVDVGADRTACFGDVVPLDAMVSDGSPPYMNFRWSTNPPGEPGDGATSSSIAVAPSQTTTYTFSADDAQGCTGSGSVKVEVRKPFPDVQPPAPVLCPGEPVSLVAAAGFASYTWTSAPPGLPGDGSTSARVDTAMPLAGGASYTVEVTDDMGCRGPQTVVLTPAPPLVPAVTPANPQICPGASVVLTAEAGFASYRWDTGGADPPVDGATTPSVTASVIGATYTVTVTNAAGCSGSSAVTTLASTDPVPGPLGPTLRLVTSGTDDILHAWQDIADPAGAYQVVSLDCDSDLDGTCDVKPTRAAMDASTMTTNVPVGVQQLVELNGLRRPSWLVFYKVRALSPCSLTPGPFGP